MTWREGADQVGGAFYPNAPRNDPWLRFAGEWGDEAEWAQFQADIAENRRLLDQQMQITEAE